MHQITLQKHELETQMERLQSEFSNQLKAARDSGNTAQTRILAIQEALDRKNDDLKCAFYSLKRSPLPPAERSQV